MVNPPKSSAKSAPERIRGVFSTVRDSFVGTGPARKKVSQTVYFFVEERDHGEISVRALNVNFVPTGSAKFVTKEELLANFLPEPTIYMHKVMPVMRRVEETVNQAESHRTRGELFTAEFDFKEALTLDEEHVRATFGLGLTYLERGENNNAAIVFQRIVSMDDAFQPRHKHLYNEFGISLRKNKMYAQALRYYFRVYSKVKTDDHLLYNISRTLFEMGRLRPAKHFLAKAMELEPELAEGASLSKVIEAAIAKQAERKSKAKGRRRS